MARPKRQDARREALLQAAGVAIQRRGLHATRVRDIADQAGVAAGTVTYYFRDLDELFRLVFAQAVDRFCTQREREAAAHEDPRDQLAAVLRHGLPTGPDDQLCCLLYEFSPHARHRDSDAQLRRELYERQLHLYRDVLTRGHASGRFDLRRPAEEIAANLVALEDAYGYHVIARTFMPRQQAEEHLFGYAALATADPSLAPENHYGPG
ncbi:TetR family transcriptional regulator [Streptomyces chumphonensis]|uniref:TetR family transcriptional regulator n=1 Tax=Streptomyces chumphonensis TaxID=1214925 RepID=A0A927ID35_9ACTN|nr:TetR family transcriptional regulator [Streptomyces chumphonensis]MBD3932264.1 TetR family transcriptional regulator [Streptomyces chumphonensis]